MTQTLGCPICRKSVQPPAAGQPSPFPFCSERCRQVDLLRWSKGQYAVIEPVSPEELLEQAAEGEPAEVDDA